MVTGEVHIDIAYGAGFVLGTVALALATYAVARGLAAPRLTDDTKSLADSMVFRVGALHGLILALVFAQELFQYQSLRDGLTEEANALTDIYYDLARYGAPEADAAQPLVARYAELAKGPEWESLGRENRLLAEPWQVWSDLYAAVLDLTPATPRQEALRDNMLAKIHALASLRDRREAAANTAIGLPFWVAAFAGVILVVLPYFRYAPTGLNLMLLGIFAGYTGLVLSVIYAFADPFSAPGRLPPADLERLLTTGMGAGA